MTQSVKLVETNRDAVRLIVPDRPRVNMAAPRKGSDGVWRSYSDGVEKLWIDKSGRRVIEGIASTGAMTTRDLAHNPKGCLVRFPVPLLFGHGYVNVNGARKRGYRRVEDARVGEVVMVLKRPDAVIVRAVIDDSLAGDAAWALIESGEARCFSVCASNNQLKGIVEGNKFYDEWTLKEVSVCFKGANPDCVFDIVERA